MKINIFIDISTLTPYLAKLWVSTYGPKCCQPIKLQGFLKCNISRKKWMMNFTFGMQINIEVFYKLIVSLWVCMVRHAQSTQNNNFILSLQYLKENVKDRVDFSLLIIVKRFFKVLLSFLMCVARYGQITQNKKLAISLFHTQCYIPWIFYTYKPWCQ